MEFVLQGGESSRTSTKESAGPKSRAPSVSPIRERQPLQASAEPPTPWRRSLDGVALHRPPLVPLTEPDRKSCGQIKSKSPAPLRARGRGVGANNLCRNEFRWAESSASWPLGHRRNATGASPQTRKPDVAQ